MATFNGINFKMYPLLSDLIDIHVKPWKNEANIIDWSSYQHDGELCVKMSRRSFTKEMEWLSWLFIDVIESQPRNELLSDELSRFQDEIFILREGGQEKV
jgi:hypothetical protein